MLREVQASRNRSQLRKELQQESWTVLVRGFGKYLDSSQAAGTGCNFPNPNQN